MMEKVKSLYKNETWDLVEPPKGRNVIGCKWVFQKNKAISRKMEKKYKAQLVAKGYAS